MPAVRGCAAAKKRLRIRTMFPMLTALPPFVVRFLLAFGFGCLFAALL